ncbi:MAG: MFS transporter [Coriobacteriia bacterium]|nr:MFS transporter [Coriobacteriia bacterium]
MSEQLEMKKSLPYFFTFSQFSQSFGTVLILQYLSFFVTDFMGISLATLAVILSACTIGDYVGTIVTGPVVQKTMTKLGQFRPFILVCPWIITICYSIVFYGFHMAEGTTAFLIGAMYTTAGFAWSSMQTARNGLIAKVAGASADNRLSITSKAAIGGRVGGVVTALVTAPIIRITGESGMNGYFILNTIYMIILITPGILLFIATKEYDTYNPDFRASAVTNVKVTEMYIDTLKNPTFLVVFLAAILTQIGTQAIGPLNTYYFRYSVGNWDLLAVSGTISMGIGIAAATFMIPVSRKLGKKKSAVISSFLVSGLNVLIAFFTDGNFVIKVILVSCVTFSQAILLAWGINLYLDAAEYQLYKTGKDVRSFVMSLSNMTARLGAVIGTPVAAIILSYSGYDPVERTFENTRTLCMFIGLAPALMSALAGLVYLFAYRITDQQAKEYAEMNQKAADERAAAAAATSSSSS